MVSSLVVIHHVLAKYFYKKKPLNYMVPSSIFHTRKIGEISDLWLLFSFPSFQNNGLFTEHLLKVTDPMVLLWIIMSL